MNTTFWDRFVTKSLRVKSLLVLFCTMVLACVLTFSIMFAMVRGRVYDLSTQVVEQRMHFLTSIYHRSDFTPYELASLYSDTSASVAVCESFEDLPPLTGVIWESEIIEGETYLSAQQDFPQGVIKLDGHYLVFSSYPVGWEPAVAAQLVFHTLVLCSAIASICTVFTLNRAIRPITKLGDAIEQVGRGDFSVSVAHRGHDEIARIVDNFNWMVGKLHTIEVLRRDFVSGVSHEFKTPIAAIAGSAKLLASTPHEKLTHERVQKYTGLILDETARMSSLSTNLLQLSKVESQSITQNLIDFPLDEQIRQAILLLEPQWSAKQLELDIQLASVSCRGNEELLLQVWINLLSNACKFTPPQGTIRINLTRDNEQALIIIADTGIGMDPPTLARIFDKFYQGDSSHQAEGNGLGLSIVKRILDLHHANVYVSSTPQIGTTCTLVLPLSQ